LGSAPNPFWGVCSLAICKPRIRNAARLGDWLVGTASKSFGERAGSVIYAMKVTRKMSLASYDAYTRQHLPGKIPQWLSSDPVLRFGDSIYDFSSDPPTQRDSVHGKDRQDDDLIGRFALLSEHFFYFGDEPRVLPSDLQAIVVQRGHRSTANAPYLEPFLDWLKSLSLEPCRLYGKPNNPEFEMWKGESGPEVKTKCG